jgi:hypothetical protein
MGHNTSDCLPKSPISKQAYIGYPIRKKKYSGLGLSELRELRQLREENGKLKRLVADLSLDRPMSMESSWPNI